MRCPNCGAENPAKSKWCGKCRFDLYKEYLKKTRVTFIIGCLLLGVYCVLSLYRVTEIHWWKNQMIILSISNYLKLADLFFGIVLLTFHIISRVKQSTSNTLITVFCFYNMAHFLIVVILKRISWNNHFYGVIDYHWIDLTVLSLALIYVLYTIWHEQKIKLTKAILLNSFILFPVALIIESSISGFDKV